MKKHKKYFVNIQLQKSNYCIETASCNCPAGINPASCKHVFALLYFLENYSKKELFKAPTETLQQWHHPKQANVSSRKVEEVFMLQKMHVDKVASVNFNALSDFKISTPIFSVIKEWTCIINQKTLSLPALVLDESIPPATAALQNVQFEELLFLHKHILLSLEEAIQLELDTVEQSSSQLWKNARSLRITASNFYEICNRKSNYDSFTDHIYTANFSSLHHIKPVAYGISYEPIIRNMLRMKYEDGTLRKTGFIVNPIFPYMGASPDGLLTYNEEIQLIEIKCIYNPKNLTLESLMKERSNFPLIYTKKYELKTNHKHYFQIQGQMAISGLDRCMYILFYKEDIEPFIECVHFNNNFWNNIKPVLHKFYFNHYLPYLMEKMT